MGFFDDLIPGGSTSGADDGGQVPGQNGPGGGPTRITVTPLDPRSRDLAIRTIYGEAGGEPPEGQRAVADVIRNRTLAGRYGGSDVPSVVLAPGQFEPWARPDARARMEALDPASPDYQRIGALVDQAWSGDDTTDGATHFFSPTVQSALGRRAPSWARRPLGEVGTHRFYAPEGRVIRSASADPSAPAGAPPAMAADASGLFDDLIPAAPAMPPGAPPAAGNATTSANGAMAAQPQVSGGRALLEGAVQGATANFGDELAGVQEASGLPSYVGSYARTPIGAARLAYEAIAGRGSATSAYEAGRDRARQLLAAAEKQHPVLSAVGQIAGAVALPVGGGLGAAGLGARMLRGAAVGAGYGAASGAGEGEGATDRVSRAVTGAALGGAVGGAVPAVAGGVRTAAEWANRALPVGGMLRSWVNPDAQAARNIAASLAEARAAGQAGLSEAEVAAGAAAGGPQRVMDMLGEPGKSLIRSAANLSPEGRSMLSEATKDRFQGQQERAQALIEQIVGRVPDTDLELEALKSSARAANRAAYRRAYQEGSAGLWTPELERLAGSDAVASAMKTAATKGRDRAIAEGHGAFNPRIRFTPDGRMEFARGPSGVPTYPDLQFWDYTRQALADDAKAAFRSGRTGEGSVLSDLAGKLNAELDSLVPAYRAARRGAAGAFGAEDALEAGKKFIGSGMELPAAARAVAKFSPEERKLFQVGLAADITQRIGRPGVNRSILNHQIFASPIEVKQLRIAFGDEGAKQFEAFLRTESVMDIARQALGNSDTARQLLERGLAGAGRASAGGIGGASIGGLATGDYSPSNLLSWALVAGGGRAALDMRVAQRVAKMLVSKDPAVIRKGLSAVSRSTRMMQALRAFDARIASAGSEQAPRGMVSQTFGGVTAGRADDENQR